MIVFVTTEAGGAVEKGRATDTLKALNVFRESATEYRAKMISISDIGGDSSANPSLYNEILLLPEEEERTINILPNVVIDAVGEKGSLHVGEEIRVTFKTGTDKVNKVVRHQYESSGQG